MSTVPANRPYRIALVTHGFEIGGGVPTIARWLRDGLNNSGSFTVDVIDLATSSRDSASRRLVDVKTWFRSSLQVRRPGLNAHYHWGANATEFEFMRYRPRRELTAALNRYDLVQVVAGTPAWAEIAKYCRVPVVLQVATTAVWERESQKAAQALPVKLWRAAMTKRTTAAELRAIRTTDVILVENEMMHDHVRRLGAKSVVMAPPGVDVDVFQPAPTGWHNDGYILSVCRLGDPRKGLDRMVRAYELMVRLQPKIPNLVLAGRGALDSAVAQLIESLGVAERVEVRPDVPAEDIVKLYQGASVFLQTSHEEGFGLSLLQAMASGLPVVATKTAGSQETVIDGVTGWLIPQTTDSDLIEAVASGVLRILSDKPNSFGSKARHRCVTEFSTSAALAKFTSTYSYLLRP